MSKRRNDPDTNDDGEPIDGPGNGVGVAPTQPGDEGVDFRPSSDFETDEPADEPESAPETPA